MNQTINAKELRASLPKIVARVRRGARFTVLYRSRPAFYIIPINGSDEITANFKEDSLYRARALGRSSDGLTSGDHDKTLYGA